MALDAVYRQIGTHAGFEALRRVRGSRVSRERIDGGNRGREVSRFAQGRQEVFGNGTVGIAAIQLPGIEAEGESADGSVAGPALVSAGEMPCLSGRLTADN